MFTYSQTFLHMSLRCKEGPGYFAVLNPISCPLDQILQFKLTSNESNHGTFSYCNQLRKLIHFNIIPAEYTHDLYLTMGRYWKICMEKQFYNKFFSQGKLVSRTYPKDTKISEYSTFLHKIASNVCVTYAYPSIPFKSSVNDL